MAIGKPNRQAEWIDRADHTLHWSSEPARSHVVILPISSNWASLHWPLAIPILTPWRMCRRSLGYSIPGYTRWIGALDGPYIFKRVHADVILAKGAMEKDYLLRICNVPSQKVEIGAPSESISESPASFKQSSDMRPYIVFLFRILRGFRRARNGLLLRRSTMTG